MATRRRNAKDIELTLEKRGEDYKKKVEAVKTKEKAPPKWPGACKLLLSIVLFLVIISCLGFGKVSVISITQCLAQARFENRTYTPPSHNITIVQSCEDEQPEPIINMILLILMVPYGITLLRCLWVTGCRGVYPWPTWTAIGVGLLASTAEVFALGLFMLEALTTVKSALGILLMNSIYAMQIFFQLVYECYKFVRPHKTGERPPSWKKLLTFLLADCLGIAAFVTIVYFSSMEGNDPDGWWKVPLCVLLISTAWSPVIQKLQTRTRNSGTKDAESSRINTKEQHPNEDEDDVMDISKRKDGRLTSSLITSFWKLLLTPAVVTLYVWLYQIFWLPGYNSVFLEQWLMLSRKTKHSNRKQFVRRAKTIRNACVYVCSTMYHESEEEMEQLLISLRGIANDLQDEANRHFESHIFFDGGCKQGQPSRWALQLMALIDKTMCPPGEVTIFNGLSCEKWETPYGLQFCWTVGARKMSFNVHLKDNSKVRAKKRWSQVMYMSYVLDYLANYNPLGMSSGAILDDDIEASSPKKSTSTFERSGPHRARLNGSSCWTAEEDGLQYIEGHPHADEWVKSFEIRYLDKSTARSGATTALGDGAWRRYGEGPDGDVKTFNITPTSGNDAVRVLLEEPIETRYLRIYPLQSNGSCSMRFEILGHHIADNLENTYLLVTDADVKFTPEAAKALLDITARDPAVGAVCARTHPMGSGAVAWYQIFDYAIGHWLNKAANNVLGTVLCCPGCFSVYRAKAVRDGLAEYSTHVTKANEFLVKDMGEDRWFCTLLVESGWKLEYSAVSEDSTFCPETFDEFFKQRRRWLPSTVANLVLVIQKWKTLVTKNSNISRLFILYQLLLLLSTLIGPGTCMLLISGGMAVAYGVDPVISMVLLVLTSVAFALLCLKTNQNVQLQIAKILTFAFAVVMAAVTVGTATDIAKGLSNPASSNSTGGDVVLLPIPISTLYFFLIIGIFIVTALLHPTEFFCLFHGIWYLFCLPSGYLLLTIYSICNLNDRSWAEEPATEERPQSPPALPPKTLPPLPPKRRRKVTFDPNDSLPDEPVMGAVARRTMTQKRWFRRRNKESLARRASRKHSNWRMSYQDTDRVGVEMWLPDKMREKYAQKFLDHGYDDTSFIAGMKESDLEFIGVDKMHRPEILRQIDKLSEYAIDVKVPDTVEEWLDQIGLEQYNDKFVYDAYDVASLVNLEEQQIRENLGIVKTAHVKRMLVAISHLRHPSETDEMIDRVKKVISDNVKSRRMQDLDEEHVKYREYKFWNRVRDAALKQDYGVFNNNVGLKEQLVELRNSWLIVLFVSNALWLTLILTLASQANLQLKRSNIFSSSNKVLDTNPLGLVFLVVFGFILIIQFLAMLVHRAWTVVHMLARIRNLWEKLDTEDTVGQKGGQAGTTSRIPDAMPATSRRGFDDAIYQNEAFEGDGENPPVYESVSSF
uniref:chitin synthase n=1 Tax=Branchiostoma floridae TaxID=7739 RepID=C3ZFZ7_BRAFL|eukprot:XP_002592461.1 hypothetical protein BRAFLDRAFT_68947 [Branchiostoma floridae]